MTRTAMGPGVMVAGLVLLTGCGGAQPKPARNAEVSGSRERSAATQERSGVQVGTVDPARAGWRFPEDAEYEPLWFSRRLSGTDRALIPEKVQHEDEDTQGLAGYTGKACRDIPPEARSACPVLAALHAVEEVPDGFLVRFEPWVDLDKLVELMRCHVAYARATGYRAMPFCPLYVPGLEIERRGEVVFFGIDRSHRTQLKKRLESHVAKDDPAL